MGELKLVADGWKDQDTKVMLWSVGNESGYSYRLEIKDIEEFEEVQCRSSLLNCSYEYAIEKVRNLCKTTGAMCVYDG
tara:strand:+ start:1819 stop:2052 length:234 start_codon:yes stop_codon:yes gene_type:complete